jgi:hypothetical protein
MKGISAFALAFALSGISIPGFAQDTWTVIDCSQSQFAVTDGMKCSETREFPGRSGTTKFRDYRLDSGNTAAVLSVGLTSDSDVKSFPLAELKNFNRVTKRGTGWGESEVAGGGMNYMRFRDGQRSCMAYRREGPPRGPSFAWLVYGMYCSAPSIELGSTEIAAVIGRLRPK